MNDVTVRALSAQDEAEWSRLYRGYREFYAEPDDDVAIARTFAMLRDPANVNNGLVAVNTHGVLVGIANWRSYQQPLEGQTALYLEDLFVDPEARGSGVGELLIRELERLARERGHRIVRWITAADNATARRLYDRVATETSWVTYEIEV